MLAAVCLTTWFVASAHAQQPTKKAASQAVAVPVAGRPTWYSEVIGNVTLSTSASPTELETEQPLVLRAVISGRTAPGGEPRRDRLQLFPESLPLDFYVEPGQDSVSDGQWEFSFTLRPKRTDVAVIPPLRLSYFDPVRRQFKTAFSDEISLKVRPRKLSAVELDQAVLAGLSPSWLDVQTTEAVLTPTSTSKKSLVWYAAAAIGPFIGLLVGLGVRRRKDPRRPYHDAGPSARDAMAQVDSATAIPELSETINDYLQDRWGFPSATPTPAETAKFLKEKGAHADVRDLWSALLREIDALRFADGLTHELAPLRQKAVEAMEALENDPWVR